MSTRQDKTSLDHSFLLTEGLLSKDDVDTVVNHCIATVDNTFVDEKKGSKRIHQRKCPFCHAKIGHFGTNFKRHVNVCCPILYDHLNVITNGEYFSSLGSMEKAGLFDRQWRESDPKVVAELIEKIKNIQPSVSRKKKEKAERMERYDGRSHVGNLGAGEHGLSGGNVVNGFSTGNGVHGVAGMDIGAMSNLGTIHTTGTFGTTSGRDSMQSIDRADWNESLERQNSSLHRGIMNRRDFGRVDPSRMRSPNMIRTAKLPTKMVSATPDHLWYNNTRKYMEQQVCSAHGALSTNQDKAIDLLQKQLDIYPFKNDNMRSILQMKHMDQYGRNCKQFNFLFHEKNFKLETQDIDLESWSQKLNSIDMEIQQMNKNIEHIAQRLEIRTDDKKRKEGDYITESTRPPKRPRIQQVLLPI